MVSLVQLSLGMGMGMDMGMHNQDLILLLLFGGILIQLILQVYLCELLKSVKKNKKTTELPQ